MFVDHVSDVRAMLTLLLAYVLAITPAGWARAYVAKKMGNDTPEQMGFLSLDPIDHFDPVGFLFLVFSRYFFGFIIGWGRHIPISADDFYGPHARLRYVVTILSDVGMHLLLATFSMTTLAILFGPSMEVTEPSSFMLSIGQVLSVFFYLNIFFAVISLVSTMIVNITAYFLARFDVDRLYVVILLAIIIVLLAMILAGFLKPIFWQLTTLLGNKCATLVKAS